MLADTFPIQALLLTISGLVNRHQADVIAFLVEENRILKEQLHGRTLRLNDDHRLVSWKLTFRDVFVPQAVPAPFVLVGSRAEAYHGSMEIEKWAS